MCELRIEGSFAGCSGDVWLPMGAYAVFGIHGTVFPNSNDLFHGDHFGYATRAFEYGEVQNGSDAANVGDKVLVDQFNVNDVVEVIGHTDKYDRRVYLGRFPVSKTILRGVLAKLSHIGGSLTWASEGSPPATASAARLGDRGKKVA